MTKQAAVIVILAVSAAMSGACRPRAAGTGRAEGWRVEKASANPILAPDAAPLFANSDFESGDWTGWTVVSGTAWINRPEGCDGAPNNDVAFRIPDLRGGYRTACSDNGGDAAVGVLKSRPFVVGRKYITFISAGWDGGAGAAGRNRIELVRVDDDAVLCSTGAPQRGTWGITRWDVARFQGFQACLRLTDANDGDARGWIGAGQFYASDSDWEDFAVRTPGLLHDGNGVALRGRDGRYWMFYSGESFDNTKRTTLQRMGLASSADLLHWTKAGEPIIPFGGSGAFDERQTADPDVVLADGILWMFYAGNDRSGPINDPQIDRGRIGLAWCPESADWTSASSWKKYENAATGNALLSPPPGDNFWGMSVLRENGRWEMWVDHYYRGTGEQIDYYYMDAARPDGADWLACPGNPVWSIPEGCGGGQTSGEIGQPSVFKHGGNYYMVYHRNCGTGRINTSLASSPDGIHWTALGDEPLLAGDDGRWDAAQIHMPFAAIIDGACVIFYSGARAYTNDLNRWSIGSARIINFSGRGPEKR